jgi:hypothetical protein
MGVKYKVPYFECVELECVAAVIITANFAKVFK